MKSPLSKVLIALLALDVVLGVLVTPAGGMDPRPPSGASATTWIAVGLYMVGLVITISAIVQLARGKPVGATLALIGPLFFAPVIASDRSDAFHAEVAPAAIRTLEWSVAALSVVVLAVAFKFRGTLGAKPTAS